MGDEMKHFGARLFTPIATRLPVRARGSRIQRPRLGNVTEGRQSLWSGTAGQPAVKGEHNHSREFEFDVRQTDSAIAYVKQDAKDSKPFFMDINFMKMHQPTIPANDLKGKSHLGNCSDSMMELDFNVRRIRLAREKTSRQRLQTLPQTATEQERTEPTLGLESAQRQRTPDRSLSCAGFC
jgi:hypothetical protein